jgi:flagellar motility protein MotE (MotC chaperone)
MNFLKSAWFGALAGTLLFCAVMVFLLHPAKVLPPGLPAPATPEPGKRPTLGAKATWDLVNPDLHRLIHELREQKSALAAKEKELNDYAARLASERAELNTVTQAVHRMQQEFERTFELNNTLIRDEEPANLKRLAKMYASMTPEGATPILKVMPDDQVVRILLYMKDTETGPLLENLARGGETEAKRAALITERIRNSAKPAAKPAANP